MAGTQEKLEDSHRALLADPSYQFDLPVYEPEPPQPPPAWLEDVLKFIAQLFDFIGPLLKWGLIIAFAALVLFILYNVISAIYARRRSLTLRRGGKAKPSDLSNVDLRPDEDMAQNLLEQADALARDGRYNEAVHLLLRSSIQDMQKRIRERIGIAMTAREIGDLGKMPDMSRQALKRIIYQVEISIFGDARLLRDDYRKTREDYVAYALEARST